MLVHTLTGPAQTSAGGEIRHEFLRQRLDQKH